MRYAILPLLFFLCGLSCRPALKNSLNSEAPVSEYLIAYNVLVDPEQDNYDIFTMNPDGSGKRNITNNPDVAWVYQAEGNRLFFLSDRDTSRRMYQLFIMGPGGENPGRFCHIRMADSWFGSRKNGTELIVKPHDSFDRFLYLIDDKGSVLQRIDPGTPYCTNPTFSPDGQTIAFNGKNKRSKREPGYREEIFTIQTDGTGLKQLSHYPENDTTAEWFEYRAGPPRWHPGGEFISFQSKQDGKYSLYAVAANGERQWKLLDTQWQEGYHSWSPDGKWLAVELFDAGETQFHIGLVNWESRELNILTDTAYRFQQGPVFVKRK